MKILLLADIHGNFPALEAITEQLRQKGQPLDQFDQVCNCGDSTVYAPFPNECLAWLEAQHSISVRGNTDDGVIRLLRGQKLKSPKNPDKRRMYENTLAQLAPEARQTLLALEPTARLVVAGWRIGLYHGSPKDHEEFLFADTPESRFLEIAQGCGQDIVITGHSHTPYHKYLGNVHFINPGSAGRMFDGDPRAAYAVLTLEDGRIAVEHHRVAYDVEAVVRELARQGLPPIYSEMYRLGRKLN